MGSKIDQIKINAISAKILHIRYLKKYNIANNIFIALTIIVPILFIGAQYIAKGTESEDIVNIFSLVMSLILISVSILCLIYRLSDKTSLHKTGLSNNLRIIQECDNLKVTPEPELKWFYQYVTEFDRFDIEIFSEIKDKDRKFAYRQALKELEPGNHTILCPICKSSPWKFVSGNCELCGNTEKI